MKSAEQEVMDLQIERTNLRRELAEAKDAAINAENLGSVRQMRKIEELERERSDLLLLIERLTKDRDSWMECANG